MMRRLLLIIIIGLFLIGCKESPKKEAPEELSELQATACNTANEAGTCDTRLNELGIISKEDCCEILGKCC